jgi:hypothetical protein
MRAVGVKEGMAAVVMEGRVDWWASFAVGWSGPRSAQRADRGCCCGLGSCVSA